MHILLIFHKFIIKKTLAFFWSKVSNLNFAGFKKS